jgi:hypothetical protein
MPIPQPPSSALRFSVIFLVLAALAPACAGRSTSDGSGSPEAKPIEECEAFLASLKHCVLDNGPASIASTRLAQARASLDAQLARSSRDAVRRQCITSLSNLPCR